MSYSFKQRPVVAFLALTLLCSYGLGLLWSIWISPQVAGAGEIVRTYLPLVFIVAGPGIAALLLSHGRNGGGSAALLRRLRFHPRDIALIVGLPIGGIALTGAVLLGRGVPGPILVDMVGTRAHLLLLHLALQFCLVGIGEELGWRGWLLPQLARRHSLWRATLLVFGAWSLWHLPKLLQSPAIALPFVLMFFALSVVFSWLWYYRQGRILPIAMAHAAVNAPIFFLEYRLADYDLSPELLLSTWQILSGLYCGMAISLLLLGWRRWSETVGAAASQETTSRVKLRK